MIAYLSEFVLDYRQSRKLKEAAVPVKLAKYIDQQEFEEMQSYVIIFLLIIL